MNPLVSIISPCYNGESYVGRFLDSVLSQTYSNIELIIVNDGSIDNTEDIILSYKDRFKEKGYGFYYIFQENAGQSAAINQGLKIFKGDYLTWPDSDDQLTPDAIERKVAFFEAHPDIGISICKTEAVDFETGEHITYMERVRPAHGDNLWRDIIMGENIYYSPGGFMVRSDFFREVMPKPLQIFSPREVGQNYQLLLPIAFKYPYGIMDDVLYIYSVRQGSHSRTKKTYKEKLHKIDVIRQTLENVVEGITCSQEDKEALQRCIDARINRLRLEVKHPVLIKRISFFRNIIRRFI